MPKNDETTALSPMVIEVIEQFAAALRADDAIDDAATDQLEKLLRKGTAPKPDEITAALFETPSDGET